MGPGLQTEIAIMVGILVGAWVLKVVAVAFYMVWSRRRLDILEQQQQERSCSNCKRIPEHVIQALPVMTYAQLITQQTAVSTTSSTACITDSVDSEGPSTADKLPSRTLLQQQQLTTRVPTAACAASLNNSPSSAAPSQQQQAAAPQLRPSLLSRLSPVLGGLGQSRSQNLSRVASSPASLHTATSDCDLAQQQSMQSTDRDCCTICFYDYAASNQVKQLPCRHYYHVECIDEWLVRDNTCPLCKRPVWSPHSSKQHQAAEPEAVLAGPADHPPHAAEPSNGLSHPSTDPAPVSVAVPTTSAVEFAIVIVPATEAAAATDGEVAGASPPQSATAGSACLLAPESMQQQQPAAQAHQEQQQSLEVVVV